MASQDQSGSMLSFPHLPSMPTDPLGYRPALSKGNSGVQGSLDTDHTCAFMGTGPCKLAWPVPVCEPVPRCRCL